MVKEGSHKQSVPKFLSIFGVVENITNDRLVHPSRLPDTL
jgi:hypothetical protein